MFCKKVKEFLSQKGVQFTEKNVAKDPDAVNELKRLGFMTIPITLIDGEAVTGFDQQKLEQLLNK